MKQREEKLIMNEKIKKENCLKVKLNLCLVVTWLYVQVDSSILLRYNNGEIYIEE